MQGLTLEEFHYEVPRILVEVPYVLLERLLHPRQGGAFRVETGAVQRTVFFVGVNPCKIMVDSHSLNDWIQKVTHGGTRKALA